MMVRVDIVRLDVSRTLEVFRIEAEKQGFEVEELTKVDGYPIYAFSREARVDPDRAPTLYISTGIHGDEPAGPLALLALLREGLPEDFHLRICPMLNPTGFAAGRRHNRNVVDLNREYSGPKEEEIRAQIAWLERQRAFDLSLLLHEDWGTDGFYLYEVNDSDRLQGLGREILGVVEKVCPIERKAEIDESISDNGLIKAPKEMILNRVDEWPEAFYFVRVRNNPNFTIETPSNHSIDIRVQAQSLAVKTAIERLRSERR